MTYFVRFKIFSLLTGHPIDALGSDSVHVLDGRKNIHSMASDARIQMGTINRDLKLNYIGFEIHKSIRLFSRGTIMYAT